LFRLSSGHLSTPTRFVYQTLLGCGAIVAITAGAAAAQDVEGSKDHPVLSRFTGAKITAFSEKSFDEATLPAGPIADANKPGPLVQPQGKITYINYRVEGAKTALEVAKNYEQALAAARFTMVYQCGNTACGAGFSSFIHLSGKVMPPGFGDSYFGMPERGILAKRTSAEGTIYVFLHVMEWGGKGLSIYQQVVEEAPMQSGQVTALDAASMGKALEADGRVALYGIYFDTGKTDIKPESKAELDEMAKLLKATPALKVYIVGHTDSEGTLAQNLDLSQRRADAVVSALVQSHGITAARLAAKGVASLAPVASNTSDAGRAKNRRVELVIQ
jgi:OOP family OmpA-OmpF porin